MNKMNLSKEIGIVFLVMMLMMPLMFTSAALANGNVLSDESFSSEIDDCLSSGKPVFLFFYVDWCHFCQQQIPIIDELEQEYAENITFFHVDCKEHPNAMKEFGANGYPSMFLIMGKGDDGQYESQYFSGFRDKETLKKSIDWIITNGSIKHLIDDEYYIAALAGTASAPLEASLCPSSPPGVKPRDSGLPSGALCRDACGRNCPFTCIKSADINICGSDGEDDFVCKYKVIECGSHQGCRDHDDCYDACWPVRCPSLASCCGSCDSNCTSKYGKWTCARWALGFGPYDSVLKFSYPPVRKWCVGSTPYCVKGKCVECRTNADCSDKDDWYCDGGTREYRDYFCSGGECLYTVTETEDCSDKDDWYCDEDTREYRDYFCSEGECLYIVTETEDCNDKDDWYCDEDTREYHDYYCSEGECLYIVMETEDCNDEDGWYCDGDTREYRDYFCSEGECLYNVTETEDCNDEDGWYCVDGYTREYRDYYCSGAECKYNVTETEDCPPDEPDCEDGECVPEFTTIAIPVVTVLGLMFLISRRRQKR